MQELFWKSIYTFLSLVLVNSIASLSISVPTKNPLGDNFDINNISNDDLIDILDEIDFLE